MTSGWLGRGWIGSTLGTQSDPTLIELLRPMGSVISQRLLAALQERVVGQEYAITAVTRAVVRALAGAPGDSSPISVLLFAGPTASGKTHVARSLAKVLFGDERKIIYINCCQLGQARDPLLNFHEQLVGGFWRWLGTPSYSAFPISLMVLEEIDKAPAGFLETLTSAIDRGWISSKGLSFGTRNLLIILTVTLSKKQVDQFVGRSIGFFADGETVSDLSKRHISVLEEMDNIIGAHIVSRTDEIVLFERLTGQHIAAFLERRLSNITGLMAAYGVSLVLDQEAKDYMVSQGAEDLTHGMRQINRVIKNMIEFPLSDLIISGRLVPGSIVAVSYESPRVFLNFQIVTPLFTPPGYPLWGPVELVERSIV